MFPVICCDKTSCAFRRLSSNQKIKMVFSSFFHKSATPFHLASEFIQMMSFTFTKPSFFLNRLNIMQENHCGKAIANWELLNVSWRKKRRAPNKSGPITSLVPVRKIVQEFIVGLLLL